MITREANNTYSSGYTWPNQNKPSKYNWSRWYLGLHLAILVDNIGCYQQPLGHWLLTWDKHPNKWHWLLQTQPPRLYHWKDEWQVHLPLATCSTCLLKFSTQYMVALQPPPMTAIRVTCTITTTQITPSGGHGALEPCVQPIHTWEEHLQQLPMDKKWAFTHLTLLNQGEQLATAIRLRQARAVSNGSFKDWFGTAMWVYYHDTTNETLGSGKLVTPGYLEDQCSYRSKLSGLYRISTTIAKLALFHDLSGGSIKVACDGKSALHQCFKPWASNPLAKHFDVIQAMRATLAQTQLVGWSWEHIQGHQDDMGKLLTIAKQWNLDMDTAAKDYWTQQQQHSQWTLI